MSSSDAQPPLSRRQARERERAAAAGAQPVTPPPTVAAPSGDPASRHRPGSHVAPSPSAPAQSARPLSAPAQQSAAAADVPPAPPASATEVVPGTGGLTRRQLRQLREAQGQAVQPVPLQDPSPQSSDRTVQDVLGSVDALPVESADSRSAVADRTPQQEPGDAAFDDAAVAQATEADGSPDAVEPLEEAAAHSEEPRRHRTTWAPPEAAVPGDDGSPTGADDQRSAAVAPDATTTGGVPAPSRPAAASAAPGVFPLSLDGDTNEVPVQSTPAPTASSEVDSSGTPRVPASFQRAPEPKPFTTAFEPPLGHWSQQAHDSNDAEIQDQETGTRRVAVTNTNAIVLPNSALADPTGALNATGEVILTGSIDLPASLSSTGSHRPIDGAEVDRLLEQHDEQPETDASPVRASRAVSSHSSTRQVVLAAAKPKESRTPVILAVSVASVGVAAAAVIIVALVTTHAFGG